VSDSILTLAQAADVVPLSEKTLRREARKGDGPFLKVANRWMVYEAELHAWVRTHKPRQRRNGDDLDPMPPPRRLGGGGSLRDEVADYRARRAG
jgi:Helix-turn-helix domain